jgi:hypothetical protein
MAGGSSHQRTVRKAAKVRLTEEVVGTVLGRIQATPGMAKEKDIPNGRFIPSHSLGIALACIFMALTIFSFLLDLSPMGRIIWALTAGLTLIYPVIHFIPKGKLRLAGFFMLAGFTVFLGWPRKTVFEVKLDRIQELMEKSASSNDAQISLPGFSVQALINVHQTVVRSYIYDRGIGGGSHVGMYVAPDNMFTFLLVDDKGESFELRAPLSSDGVPLNEAIFLSCDIGITATTTRMGVTVNGKTVASREIPSIVDLHTILSSGGMIGGNVEGKEFGNFILYELLLFERTLKVSEMKQILKAVGKDHPGVQYPIIN